MLDHIDVISRTTTEVSEADVRTPEDSKGRNEMYSAVAAGSPLWSPRSTR
jgi:hypothetical protein